MQGYTGEALLLELQLADEVAGLFPRVTIYSSAGAIQAGPIDLADRGGGLYQVEWLVPVAGQFSARYLTYSDALHTTRTMHEPGLDSVRIDDRALDAVVIAAAVWDAAMAAHSTDGSFGLALISAANDAGVFVLWDGGAGTPNASYNANNNLTSGRSRIFPNLAARDAATPGAADGADGEIKAFFWDEATYTPASTVGVVPELLRQFKRSAL
jgi:hypothetical protein